MRMEINMACKLPVFTGSKQNGTHYNAGTYQLNTPFDVTLRKLVWSALSDVSVKF